MQRLLVAVLLLGLAAPAGAVSWESLGERPVPSDPALRETRWVARLAPGAAHDRIGLHRYRGPGEAKAALLYLPGTYMNGELAVADARNDLWLQLARRGVEVWALDYRTHFVPTDAAGDHAYMRDWTLDRFVADAGEALAFARAQSGRPRLFVAGFSRGVTLAFGVACTSPGLAGLVVLDGPFKRAAAEPFDLEAARDELLAGRSANDVAHRIGWAERQRLMETVAKDPGAPALAPGFETAGEQLARVLHGAWRPGGLADPVGGVSRVQVLAQLMAGYDRYWPAVQDVEGRSIASQPDDPRTPIDDCWGSLGIPVLYFGATNMGAEWILDGVHTAVRSGSEDVELHLLEGYGHLDVLVGERAGDEVYEPISRWILDRSPALAE